MSNPDAIDYQPLLVMDGVWQIALKDTVKLWGPGIVGGFILVSLAASLFLASILAMGAVFLYFIILSIRIKKLKNGVWKQFAAANGWTIDVETPPEVVVPPSLQFGHSRELSPVIQAQIGDMICDLLTYCCVTGSGKSQQTHNFTIACTSLPRPLPHMLLMSKKSRADVRRDLLDGENLKLEGDFDDYFGLQIEKGQEVDVLTIITPDVMQALVDYGQTEDIEVLGNNVYFITNKDQRDYRDMQALIRSVVELGQQIIQNIPKVA